MWTDSQKRTINIYPELINASSREANKLWQMPLAWHNLTNLIGTSMNSYNNVIWIEKLRVNLKILQRSISNFD
jgi:hypothetical protein